jgi:hypothetical protein
VTLYDLRRIVAAVFQAAINVAPREAETQEAAHAQAVVLGWLQASGEQISAGVADELLVAAAAHAGVPLELEA